MKPFIKVLVLLVVAILAVYLVPKKAISPKTEPAALQEEEMMEPEVIVDTPAVGDLVTSPLTVKGRAKGYWFFEANLPVTLKDQNGNILVQKGFPAQGDWMTENYVEFQDVLIFSPPTTQFGVLIIEKDNPSGLPENEASFAVPVTFQ